MFIAINNDQMDMLKVDELINRARDENGGRISSECAMNILSKTNHLANIKKILDNLKDNCKTTEELMPYKEFILSCVDGREMSPQALEKLNELAGLCGCKDELEKINKKYKYYDAKACEKNVTVSSQEELEALTGTDLDVLFVQEKEDEHDQYMILDVDFAGVKKLRFSKFANIHIQGGKDFPKEIDFSNCYAILVNYADFNGDEDIKWASSSKMYSVRNIPANTDLSHCNSVVLEHCKFGKDGELKVGGVCDTDHSYFPKKVDLSNCSAVYSEFPISLYGVEELKLKNKSQKSAIMAKFEKYEGKIVYEEVEKEISFADRFKKFWEREVG
jgi:hypothetical protein